MFSYYVFIEAMGMKHLSVAEIKAISQENPEKEILES